MIDLKVAESEGDVTAGDDPVAVELMIDFLYLQDYDLCTLRNRPFAEFHCVKNDTGALGGTMLEESAKSHRAVIEAKEAHEEAGHYSAGSFADEPVKTIPLEKSCSQEDKKYDGDRTLATHAEVYALASKYNVQALKDAAIQKFKSHINEDWDIDDLVAAIPIVFNRTAGNETELRDSLETAILANLCDLTDNADFTAAVENVDGLTFRLLRQMGHRARNQRTCKSCGHNFISKCASTGCSETSGSFGYRAHHDCDLKGPCRRCAAKSRF